MLPPLNFTDVDVCLKSRQSGRREAYHNPAFLRASLDQVAPCTLVAGRHLR